MKTHSGKMRYGFTLVELLVVIAVMTILATVAFPQLGRMIANNQTVANYNMLITSVNLARTEAVKRNERVRICAGSTVACGSSNWENGWIVVTADDVILQEVDALGNGHTLRLSGTTGTETLVYRASGTLGNISGTFTLCDDTALPTRAKAVNINLMGQPSRARDIDDPVDNIVNDVTGANVSCP